MKVLFNLTFALVFSLFSNLAYCQISEKDLIKIPKNFTNLLYTRENEKGMVMSYKQFKKGNFIEASDKEKSTFMTTMLLGSGTFLYNYLSNKYPDFKPVVIQPNGFTSTSFKVRYEFSEGEIFIMRIMKGKISGLDPMAAEDPKDYMLVYGFDIKDEEQSNKIRNVLIQHFDSSNTYYEEIADKKTD